MPKKKNIDGVIYYPIKKHAETKCIKCGRYIKGDKTAYTTVDNKNTNDLLCTSYMNHMVIHNRQEKEKSAVEYPKDHELFIGTTHKCNNRVFENNYFFFCKDGKFKRLVVKKCSECGKYFWDFKDYEPNSYYLDEYLLIRSSTGKEMIKSERSENYSPLCKTEPKQIDIPDTVRWAAAHPYQGGGCSGK